MLTASRIRLLPLLLSVMTIFGSSALAVVFIGDHPNLLFQLVVHGSIMTLALFVVLALTYGREARARRLAEAALRESEARYRLISDMISDFAYMVAVGEDGRGRHQWITDSISRITGYTAAELDARGATMLYHPDDRARFAADREQVLLGHDVTGEYRLITKSGELRWMKLLRHAIWNEAHTRVTRFVGVAQDITERKQAEDALRESEARYRLISESISDFAFAVAIAEDGTLRHEWTTDSILRVTGYTAEEINAIRPHMLYHPDERGRVMEDVQTVMAGDAVSGDYRIVTKDGETRWLSIHRRAVWDEAHTRVIRFVGVAQDITERRQAEVALRESEARYRLISELISDYAFSFAVAEDGTRTPEWITDSISRVTGYSVEEAVAQSPLDIYHPDDHAAVEADVRQVLAGNAVSGQYRIVTKGGETRWLTIHRRPVWDDTHTRIVRFVGVAQDITERRRAEAALRESEARYRSVFEGTSVGIVISDREGYPVTANQQFERMLGYTSGELRRMRFAEFTHPDDVDTNLAYFNRFVAGEIDAYQMEKRYLCKDGGILWVRLNVSRFPTAENEAFVIAMIEDIHERKTAEDALARERTLLRTLIDTLPDPIYVKDMESRFVLANQAMADHVGAAAADGVIGRHDFDFFPDHMAAVYFADEQALLASGKPLLNFEQQSIRPDGTLFWVMETKAPLYDHDGTIIGLVGMSRDITDVKRMQDDLLEKEKLRLALNKEAQLQKMRSRFMSMASHEFRTPLATMLLSADMIERYSARLSPESWARHIEKIKTEGKYLTEMLDDILIIMKTESVGHDFKPDTVDVAALCRKLVSEAQLNAGTCTLVFDSQALQATTLGDEKLLRHAINNLLSNAIKYSPEQGRIYVAFEADDRTMRLTVRDEGIGIPADSLPLVFEPFYRASNVREIAGTGLGLIIAQQAVELHGGTITVESTVGMGSTFTIELPVECSQPDERTVFIT